MRKLIIDTINEMKDDLGIKYTWTESFEDMSDEILLNEYTIVLAQRFVDQSKKEKPPMTLEEIFDKFKEVKCKISNEV